MSELLNYGLGILFMGLLLVTLRIDELRHQAVLKAEAAEREIKKLEKVAHVCRLRHRSLR